MSDLPSPRELATQHAARLSQLLEAPNLNSVKARLFRARYWHNDELLVVSIIQRFNMPEQVPAVSVLISRGYQHFPAHAPSLDLTGKYSVYSIVAFLRLDTVDLAAVEWKDETTYLVVPSTVDAIMEKLR
jgi:hypothetical protein